MDTAAVELGISVQSKLGLKAALLSIMLTKMTAETNETDEATWVDNFIAELQLTWVERFILILNTPAGAQ